MKDVAFSCDDNGARFLCVTVWSLLHHYHGSEPIRINVFEGFGGHSEASKRQLAKVVGEFPNASVRYVNVEAAIAPYADLIMNRERSRWNVFTWTPIFTPMLLGDATGNVAHFDIDMLFNDDVSKLLDLDLGDNLIAADALHCQDDTARTVLEQGGDYVLQVKSNRPALVRQCQELAKARELVGLFKKKS